MDQTDSAARLRWPGRLLVGLVFAAGTAGLTYLGLVVGLIVGVQRGTEGLDEPRPGVGLAPDLTGVIELFLSAGVGVLAGAAVGLLVGVVVMGALCRYALAPLVRAVPGLGYPGHRTPNP